MVHAAAPIVGVVAVVLGVFYQFALQPKLYYSFGVGRPVATRNNQNCQIIPELEACEDTWYHQGSGLLYLACSSKAGRHAWLPNGDHYNLKTRPDDDYFAIVDTKGEGPISSRITKIEPQGFFGNNGRGAYNLHGFGVFMSGSNTKLGDSMRLFVINHRPQPDAEKIGANSTIELFESTLGSATMQHVKTFADADVISTPNSVKPVAADAFVFSNDHAVKLGPKKQLDFLLARSSLGYCDAKAGCKIAMSPVQYPNGLAGGLNYPHKDANVIYQASTSTPYIQVLELQADKSLVLVDRIRTDYIMDNLGTDEDGAIWAAGFPKAFEVIEQMKNPNPKAGASAVALRVTKNTGEGAFYGQKYKVDHAVEDDGSVINFITSVSYDTERKIAFMGSVIGPTAFCQLTDI